MLDVCTIMEGHYHFGVATLINSLLHAGFSGRIWIGYRGQLPTWISQLKKLSDTSYRILEVDIHFSELSTKRMLANAKPCFMLDILKSYSTDSKGLVYFDPDIVLECRWNRVLEWIEEGIAVCQDNCFPVIPRNHLLRRNWSRDLQEITKSQTGGFLEAFFNSGFIGISRKDIAFLELWARSLEFVESKNVDLSKFKQGERWDPYSVPDQDTFNLSAMAFPERIVLLGTEGMGFTPGLRSMSHAVDAPKPWKRNYFFHLLRHGQKISSAHRRYWRYCNSPIKTYSPIPLFIKKIDLAIAVFLSRVIGK